MPNSLKNLLGALVGGFVGYWVFVWFLGHSFYAMIAPGGLLGLGASFFRHRSFLLPIATCGMAMFLGVFTEWKHFPFKKDESLGFFLQNVGNLKPVTLLMIGLGAALAFYLPYSKYQRAVLPQYQRQD
jgi:hypothetical protein